MLSNEMRDPNKFSINLKFHNFILFFYFDRTIILIHILQLIIVIK